MSNNVQDELENTTGGDSGGGGLLWFVTGALIGATVAVLYAPKSGKDTRQYISDKAQQGKDAIADSSADVVDASKEMFERGRKLVEDAAELFDRGRKLVKG
jgi:gas vesicle protein